MKNKLLRIGLAALGLSAVFAHASTFVSGNVSGTWTKTGSPYIATGSLTVPNGQTLTVQPGVTVIMGQGLSIDVEGVISAIGTAAERIVIRGANSSLHWDRILVNYRGVGSTFINCTIKDAANALYLVIDGGVVGTTATMTTPIQNCVFSNCLQSCVYGYARGQYASPLGGPWTADAALSPRISNCLFAGSTNGCSFMAEGESGYITGYGTVNPQILNCAFVAIAGDAMNFDYGAYAAASYPNIQNNIFVDCGTAMKKSSSTLFNDMTAYNCF